MTDETRRAQFEQALSDEVYGAAWRYACRLCTAGGVVRRDDAEDLLQESLVHAFQRLHQLRDAASFKGWLLSIMRTRFITRHRRERLLPATLEWPEALPAAVEADPLVEEALAALSRLPASQRELLSLFYIDGLNLHETGQVAGLAPRVVRQRLHRARAALRRELRLLAPQALRQTAKHPGTPEGVIPCE